MMFRAFKYRLRSKVNFNPWTTSQTYTSTVVRGRGGGGGVATPPLGFCGCYNILEIFYPCRVFHKIRADPLCHPTWPPSWILLNNRMENAKITDMF